MKINFVGAYQPPAQIEIEWTDVSLTELTGHLVDNPNVKVYLGRKLARGEHYCTFQLAVPPENVRQTMGQAIANGLPDALKPWLGASALVNGHDNGQFEERTVGYGYYEGMVQALQATIETEAADTVFQSVGGQTWAALGEAGG